jgi:hypothetical protein
MSFIFGIKAYRGFARLFKNVFYPIAYPESGLKANF